MKEWKGLDSGGTEQLWDSKILIDMLSVMKKHEPFARNNKKSPIFKDLENIYPNITWRNVNADGSFRPIFRKSNPLVKLGLVTDDANNGRLTTLGNDLLVGNLSVPEVFIIASKEHKESDNIPSMAYVCAAAIECSSETFTVNDIEYGISQYYDPKKVNAQSVLNNVRKSNTKVSATRQRRLRHLMNSLVQTGALLQIKDGWKLHNSRIARDIANTIGIPLKVSTTTQGNKNTKATSPKTIKSKVSSNNVRKVTPGAISKISVMASLNSKSSPEERALLLERANNTHQEIVSELAEIIEQNGYEPLECVDTFDLGIVKNVNVLIEVKTIHASNWKSQIRKALAQLPEYRWKHKNIFPVDTKQVVVLSENPMSYLEQDYLDYISQDRNIFVIWKQQDEYVDSGGHSIQEILFPN